MNNSQTEIEELKEDAASLVERAEIEAALKKLKELLYMDMSFLTVSFLNTMVLKIPQERLLKISRLKMSIVCNATIEPFDLYLKAEAFKYDLFVDIHIADHYRYAEEIMRKESALYCRDNHLFVFLLVGEELNPDLYFRFDELTSEQKKENISQTISSLSGFINKVKSFSRSAVILSNFAIPALLSDSIFNHHQDDGQRAAFTDLNAKISKLALQEKGIYYFDFDRVVNMFGKDKYRDMKRWYLAKQPFSTSFMPLLSRELMRTMLPLSGKNKKCLVLDLDNTLWGGIVGEDGMENIHIGETPQGRAYLHFQRAIVSLYNRGIILAINSKNNASEAMKVLDEHPDMILRKKHFSAIRINWNNKTDNIKSIAQELNIGTDSMVFIDDSPEERELVRVSLPEVLVPFVSQDPAGLVATLQALPVFDSAIVTSEDKKRAAMYADESKRLQIQNSFSDITDFYRALAIKVFIGKADKFTIPRISQLAMRTNQFNLTTRRYSSEEIALFCSSEEYAVFWLRSEDKYGSNGIVAAAIIKKDGGIWFVDTFLMSCRVIGRTIEKAFLSYIVSLARSENIDEIRAEYIPTQKNQLAKDFFKDNAFLNMDENNGHTGWALKVKESAVSCPPWIEIIIEDNNKE